MVAGSESSKFRACGSNIYDPNINGSLFTFGSSSDGCFTPSSGQIAEQVSGAGYGIYQKTFNASTSSSIYKNDVTTVRVDAVLGMNLIRAF